MSFINNKEQSLSKPDKSLAGRIDPAISSLVKKINSKEDYYTTSSCAGRIIVIPETGKKQKNIFYFIYHNPITFEKLMNDINKLKNNKKSIYINDTIYLKHEPCILHIACKDLKKALCLINIARNAGWKKSGIISVKPEKVMCELVSTEILAAPIIKKGKLITPKDYLKILVKECNKKLTMTRKKIRKFEKAL